MARYFRYHGADDRANARQRQKPSFPLIRHREQPLDVCAQLRNLAVLFVKACDYLSELNRIYWHLDSPALENEFGGVAVLLQLRQLLFETRADIGAVHG